MWWRFKLFVYTLFASSDNAYQSGSERPWPIQFGADFHGWTRNDGYLHRLYAN